LGQCFIIKYITYYIQTFGLNMSKSLHSSVMFNALQAHPELESIGNELITRIKAILKNPQVEFSTSNGLNRLNLFGLIELTQDANHCGFISTSDAIQIENLKDGSTPTKLPVWGGNYINSKSPSPIKLPLVGFSGFYLPISILHALKYEEHQLVKKYLINAVLFQLVQEKPELFCAPIRSLHWASSYIHYVEQIFKLENTAIDGLPFISFDTAELDGLCEITEQAYVENFLNPDLVKLFCFYSFDSYKQGDIHQQYVRFANSYGFAKEQLIKQFNKDPLAYTLSVLYCNFGSIADPSLFASFIPSQVVSDAFYKQAVQQPTSTKRLVVRNLSALSGMAKDDLGVKVVHNLYLHTLNTYPNIAKSNDQLNNHIAFFERAKFLDQLSVEQFTTIMLGLDQAIKENTAKKANQVILNTVELIQIWVMSKNKILRQSANIDQIKLIAKIRDVGDLDKIGEVGFSSLLDSFIEIKENTDDLCETDDDAKSLIGLEPFQFTNNELSLVLISQIQEIKSTLLLISTDEKFHADVLNHNRNLINVQFGDEESILVVDPRMVGFKYLFENLISTSNEPISELAHNAVNIALQQINFG